ncbi:YqcC family protein [Kaarinaea lacus]
MHNQDTYNRIATLLGSIQQEMEHIGIWEDSAPPVVKLASDQPFCYDTLHVGQWIQWIFIPRMKAMIDHRSRLPQVCDIHTYAEESLAGYTINTVTLLSLIREIDGVITHSENEH